MLQVNRERVRKKVLSSILLIFIQGFSRIDAGCKDGMVSWELEGKDMA